MFFELVCWVWFFLSFASSLLMFNVVMLVGMVSEYLFFNLVIPWLTSLVIWLTSADTIIVFGSAFILKWLIWLLLNNIFPVLLIKNSHWIKIALKWSNFPVDWLIQSILNRCASFWLREIISLCFQLFSLQISLKFFKSSLKFL